MACSSASAGELNSARLAFPAGLEQPSGSYRFGLEALLLAALALKASAARREARGNAGERDILRIAELGCGCGAALLGYALADAQCLCLGLDREAVLLAAARRNAIKLELEGRVAFAEADFSATKLPRTMALWLNHCDFVMANPPWHGEAAGRLPVSGLRRRALTAPPHIADHFCRHAARLLNHHGFFHCVIQSSNLSRYCQALQDARLGLRRVLPVVPEEGKTAPILLLTARKNACAEPVMDYPLVLRSPSGARGKGSQWTIAALEFCPWLAGQVRTA